MRQEPDGLPDNPDFFQNTLVWALYLADQCEEALQVSGSMKDPPLMTIAACQVRLGSIGAGKTTMAAFVQAVPDWTLKDEESFPFQMAQPLQKRWLDDILYGGLATLDPNCATQLGLPHEGFSRSSHYLASTRYVAPQTTAIIARS